MTAMTDMTRDNTAQAPEAAQATSHAHGQQHPIKLYLVVWGWLFILSTCSYLVDYFDFQGYLRWFLILLFMILKAGLIVAIFMHMAWERLALVSAILLPPLAVLVFMAIMAFESDYTHFDRLLIFRRGPLTRARDGAVLGRTAPDGSSAKSFSVSDQSMAELIASGLHVGLERSNSSAEQSACL